MVAGKLETISNSTSAAFHKTGRFALNLAFSHHLRGALVAEGAGLYADNGHAGLFGCCDEGVACVSRLSNTVFDIHANLEGGEKLVARSEEHTSELQSQ